MRTSVTTFPTTCNYLESGYATFDSTALTKAAQTANTAVNINNVIINDCDVLNCLSNLDIKKGCGPNLILPIFTRTCAHYLARPLLLIS